LANLSRKRKRRELIPYSELPTKRHRLQRLQKELEYIAGQHHSKEDEENILRDFIQTRELRISSSQEQILRNNIHELLSKMKPHGLARRIIVAQLTKGLSVKEAAEITGLTIDQIKKARIISKEFDLSLIKMEVSKEIFR
jgi:DNA-directed RNA polymerase specialized sigma24 family protein